MVNFSFFICFLMLSSFSVWRNVLGTTCRPWKLYLELWGWCKCLEAFECSIFQLNCVPHFLKEPLVFVGLHHDWIYLCSKWIIFNIIAYTWMLLWMPKFWLNNPIWFISISDMLPLKHITSAYEEAVCCLYECVCRTLEILWGIFNV